MCEPRTSTAANVPGRTTPFLAFAHRGGAAEAPENTRTAFRRAVRLGCTHIETDVRLTSDGVVVIVHDASLERTHGRPERVEDLSYERLQQIGAADGGQFMRLAEALTEFPNIFFNIDAKTDAVCEPLLTVIAECDAWRRVALAAFDSKRLHGLRLAAAGRLRTGLSKREIVALLVRAWVPFANRVLTVCGKGAVRFAGRGSRGVAAEGFCVAGWAAQVPRRFHGFPVVSKRFVRVAHACGVQVHVWTVDDAAVMKRLIGVGVDGIISDRPSVLLRVLTECGLR